MFDNNYFKVGKNDISQFQLLVAYLGGSAFQTVVDNPITAYRQLVQQYAKGVNGESVHPSIAAREAKKTFRGSPVSASFSGLGPRLVGVGFKRVPKFGILLGASHVLGNDANDVGYTAATAASILSAPFINPIRMVEKQQRAYFRQNGRVKPAMEVIKESSKERFRPLFRGTVPLMGHSLASALLGLAGQPKLQKYIQSEVGNKYGLSNSISGLIASSVVSPIYVAVTNPLSRLEVIMQTSSIKSKGIGIVGALKELARDGKKFGLSGVFRGQGVGIAKAIVSLSLFHEARLYLIESFQKHNRKSLK